MQLYLEDKMDFQDSLSYRLFDEKRMYTYVKTYAAVAAHVRQFALNRLYLSYQKVARHAYFVPTVTRVPPLLRFVPLLVLLAECV